MSAEVATPNVASNNTMKATAKPGLEESAETKSYNIRMTLSSTKMKAVEQAVRDIMGQAAKKNVLARGPARIPTKTLRITTRKTPCGEGSKTWDRYEMCIYKRVIDFTCTMIAMRDITAIKIEPGVEIEVTVARQ